MNKDNKKEIKVTPFNNGEGAKIDIYSPLVQKPNHMILHVKVNTKTGKYEAVTKIDGKKESSSGGCYLTTACMKHYADMFSDNCYELNVLRWFRDNFVSENDIKHYYNVAPYIIEEIEQKENKNIVYDYIYDNIIDYCVIQIENGNYEEAYKRYKSSIISLEELYARRVLGKRLIKTFNK